MFTWQIEEQLNQTTFTPYQGTLLPGEVTLTYSPAIHINPQSVEALTIHLEGKSNPNPSDFSLSLWDNQQAKWTQLTISNWGNQTVQTPTVFVNPSGQIKVKLKNSGTNGQYFDKIDFSLKIHP